MEHRLTALVMVAIAVLMQTVTTAADERADPIGPPPEDRSTLPPVREGVVMVRVQKDGRLNVQLGGWGGMRLIQAKTEPEKFRALIRAVKSRGLNTVRPLFHPPNAANKNDAEWAKFDWEAMDRAVAITQEEGMYFLVDYHNWGVNDTISTDEKTWLQNWAWIFDRYKPYKHLIFEGFNEPQNQGPDVGRHYQKWIDLARSKGIDQLCVVSPFWGKYFPIKDPADNWAQCRHHYFNAHNSASPEKARGEADWQLSNLKNSDSAASATAAFGCGFFMTEGGIDDKPTTDIELAARVAGVQRVVDDCEQHGYAWCLWAWGDWAKGLDEYGTKITTKAAYPSITGEPAAKE
jgi:hypothetical protein